MRTVRTFTVCLALLVGVASQVSAQATSAARPYRGLFGGGLGETEQLLKARATFGVGYDDNLAAGESGGIGGSGRNDLSRSLRGGLGSAAATISYQLTKEVVDFDASLGSSFRYYPTITDNLYRRVNARIEGAYRLPGPFTTHGYARYAPHTLMLLQDLRDTSPLIAPDLASSTQSRLSYGGTFGFSPQLSTRASLSSSYVFRARQAAAGDRDFQSQSAGAVFRYQMTRGLGLRAGYRYTEARYGDNDLPGAHSVDLGVDYSRALSFTRNTTLAFSTGSIATRSSRNENLRYRATGNATLSHQMGRTWATALDYSRGVRYEEQWGDAVFADSVTASLSGLISRTLQSQTSAGFHRGRRAFSTSDTNLEVYHAGTRLSYALSRFSSLGLEYGYYRHRVPPGMPLPDGLTGRLDRHSVRGTVSLWAPLFHTQRKTDASR